MSISLSKLNDSEPTVAIIGAGVSGLSIGWRLAQAGAHVEIFERSDPGRGASWAAAGMLAARSEAEPGEETLLQLNLKSQKMWPSFKDEVEAAAHMPIDYRDEGTLTVALDQDDAEALHFNYKFQSKLGLEVEWLSGREVRKRESFLSPNVTGAVYSPLDHQVENRLLVDALRIAFIAAGGIVHNYTEINAIETKGDTVTGVRCGEKHLEFDVVVLAAGAWSRTIKGLPKEFMPPVRPLKGQMLALRMDVNEPLLRHVLWAPKGIYMVPRTDGRILIGATVEEKDFDADLTAGGVLHLLRESWEALPGIDELPIDEMWVGHRPTSRDDAPILGPTDLKGLVMATGHHRNGILLTPVTADAISRYIIDGIVPAEIVPFGLDRFQKKQSHNKAADNIEFQKGAA
ncbi:MAG: glycine oxidase ThiO [Rhodospirillaceae bacterium]|nr:glycine oxidase ThiO [Rhodospirillaceae bacterium]